MKHKNRNPITDSENAKKEWEKTSSRKGSPELDTCKTNKGRAVEAQKKARCQSQTRTSRVTDGESHLSPAEKNKIYGDSTKNRKNEDPGGSKKS